jgi:probable H4MPT-linked C1 transfer pathway protein
MNYTSGWDIGGAHIKVARSNHKGEIIDVIQVPCPLWLGIEQLDQAINAVFQQLNNQHDQHGVTMTGELVDIFANRQRGVAGILACLSKHIPAEHTHVYAADAGWLPPSQAPQQWQQVASRNWQASASLVAQLHPQGLFIDIGSTTCDIIPFYNGDAQPQGIDDFQRQTTRELLYTGTIRTPLIAVSQTAPFNGVLTSIAAELFATTGDVWCLLDLLDPDTIQDESADGQAWNHNACATRIARLLGTDANIATLADWKQLAQWFAEQQLHQITQAVLQVSSAQANLSANSPIIGAGVGRFIVKLCAERLQRPYIDFATAITTEHQNASDHAPAVAVALLAQRHLQ